MRMAIDGAARNPGRSMLSAALVGCASFVIVAVAANRKEFGSESLSKDSGSGGFSLFAQADVPLHHDLNDRNTLAELGFSEADLDTLADARFFPMRVLPGDDASCLNLYQPQQPRVVGVPRELINRGGFAFHAIVDAGRDGEGNPWSLLEQDIAPEVIPAFGDFNSVQWILKLGLGRDLVIRNEFGEAVKLRFVGLLEGSIFQSEVIISEQNFLEHFPGSDGYAGFLIETPAGGGKPVALTLERLLADYGFDATSTRDKLAGYQAVENTYLSVFQTLGGLGLLLGTIGLGIVLIRNAIERRGEHAMLRAFGFQRSALTLILLVETAYLILAGMGIGTFSALLSVAPHLLAGAGNVPWLPLGLTLLAVFLVGLIAGAVALAYVLRMPLLPALKAE